MVTIRRLKRPIFSRRSVYNKGLVGPSKWMKQVIQSYHNTVIPTLRRQTSWKILQAWPRILIRSYRGTNPPSGQGPVSRKARNLSAQGANFKFHCIIFKTTETLILNVNTANTKQLSVPEKLPGPDFREKGLKAEFEPNLSAVFPVQFTDHSDTRRSMRSIPRLET